MRSIGFRSRAGVTFFILILSALIVTEAVFANDSGATIQNSYVSVLGSTTSYYSIDVYSMNGSLVAYEYSDVSVMSFNLPQGEYIIVAQTPEPGSPVYGNEYKAGVVSVPYWYSSNYAYQVARAPFNIQLTPVNISSFGCTTVLVNSRFENGSAVTPSWVYGYPLAYPAIYPYSQCSGGYSIAQSSQNTINIPSVPSVITDYYDYPVTLEGGSVNETVDAGGLRANVTVNFWPTYIFLLGSAVAVPPIPSSLSISLNQTYTYGYYFATPAAETGFATSTSQPPYGAPGVFPTSPGISGSQTAPGSGGAQPVIVQYIQPSKSIATTSGSPELTLVATSLVGAAAVASVGYLISRRKTI